MKSLKSLSSSVNMYCFPREEVGEGVGLRQKEERYFISGPSLSHSLPKRLVFSNSTFYDVGGAFFQYETYLTGFPLIRKIRWVC